jgi:hypothetical protein
MRINKYIIILLVGLSVVISGCRTNPVLNIDDSPISVNTKSSNDVKKAIIRAGTSLGWVMKSVGKGHIEGTLLLREHMAKVDIKYNQKTFSITYKDSSPSLKYDGTNIHTNYNGWIQNLDRRIQAELSLL